METMAKENNNLYSISRRVMFTTRCTSMMPELGHIPIVNHSKLEQSLFDAKSEKYSNNKNKRCKEGINNRYL